MRKVRWAVPRTNNAARKRHGKFVVKGIRCRTCKDELWSRDVHDLRSCFCGASFVDGGRDYLRAGGDPIPEIIDIRLEPRDFFTWTPADSRIKTYRELDSDHVENIIDYIDGMIIGNSNHDAIIHNEQTISRLKEELRLRDTEPLQTTVEGVPTKPPSKMLEMELKYEHAFLKNLLFPYLYGGHTSPIAFYERVIVRDKELVTEIRRRRGQKEKTWPAASGKTSARESKSTPSPSSTTRVASGRTTRVKSTRARSANSKKKSSSRSRSSS
jgi:hypothetical protein